MVGWHQAEMAAHPSIAGTLRTRPDGPESAFCGDPNLQLGISRLRFPAFVDPFRFGLGDALQLAFPAHCSLKFDKDA